MTAKLPRIGYLSAGPHESRADRVDAFLEGLREFGYVEGQTIAIEWRFTLAGSDARFAELAAELVGLPVDLVITVNTPPSLAVTQVTDTVPAVAVIVENPVRTGLVASLARPGGNITGLSGFTPGFEAKSVELLREVVPGLARVAALVDATNVANVTGWAVTRTAAEQAGLQVTRIDLRSAEDVLPAFEAAVSSRADAVIDNADPLLVPVAAQVAGLALRHQLPAISYNRPFAAAGLLMSYGPNLPAVHRRAAVYGDKILKRAKPAELPVEQPSVFDLVVNVKTRQRLGLTIPPSVQPLVTECIQ